MTMQHVEATSFAEAPKHKFALASRYIGSQILRNFRRLRRPCMMFIIVAVQATTGALVPAAGPVSQCHAAAGTASAGPLHEMRLGAAHDEVGGAGAGTVRVLCRVEV